MFGSDVLHCDHPRPVIEHLWINVNADRLLILGQGNKLFYYEVYRGLARICMWMVGVYLGMVIVMGIKTYFFDGKVFSLFWPMFPCTLAIWLSCYWLMRYYKKKMIQTELVEEDYPRFMRDEGVLIYPKRKKDIVISFDTITANFSRGPTWVGIARKYMDYEAMDQTGTKRSGIFMLGRIPDRNAAESIWCMICQYMDTDRPLPSCPDLWNTKVEVEYGQLDEPGQLMKWTHMVHDWAVAVRGHGYQEPLYFIDADLDPLSRQYAIPSDDVKRYEMEVFLNRVWAAYDLAATVYLQLEHPDYRKIKDKDYQMELWKKEAELVERGILKLQKSDTTPKQLTAIEDHLLEKAAELVAMKEEKGIKVDAQYYIDDEKLHTKKISL